MIWDWLGVFNGNQNYCLTRKGDGLENSRVFPPIEESSMGKCDLLRKLKQGIEPGRGVWFRSCTLRGKV
jgi:hypothetical protein